MMTYHPGDSYDVLCPNRTAEVEDMLHRLGLHDQRNHKVHISLRKDTKKKGKVCLSNDINMYSWKEHWNYQRLHSTDNKMIQ